MKQAAARGASKVVVVDDDPDLRELLTRLLAHDDHDVVEMPSGDHLLSYLKANEADVLILDVMLPGEDGMALCTRVRADGHELPIIMLTARDDELDRVLGLELGADDYVLKPFSGPELRARVKAALRRARGSVGNAAARDILLPGWTFRPLDMELIADDGLSVSLSSSETELLLVFVRNPAVPLGRTQLMALTKRDVSDEAGRSIDTLISRLRRKLHREGEAELIKTVWGRGYMFAAVPEMR